MGIIIFVVLIFLGFSIYKNYKQKQMIIKINQESKQAAELLEDTSITPEEVLPYKKKRIILNTLVKSIKSMLILLLQSLKIFK